MNLDETPNLGGFSPHLIRNVEKTRKQLRSIHDKLALLLIIEGVVGSNRKNKKNKNKQQEKERKTDVEEQDEVGKEEEEARRRGSNWGHLPMVHESSTSGAPNLRIFDDPESYEFIQE